MSQIVLLLRKVKNYSKSVISNSFFLIMRISNLQWGDYAGGENIMGDKRSEKEHKKTIQKLEFH